MTEFLYYSVVLGLNEYQTPASANKFSKFKLTDSIPSDGTGGCKYYCHFKIIFCHATPMLSKFSNCYFSVFYFFLHKSC